MASGPITLGQIDGETEADFIWGGSKITVMVIAAMKLKDAYSLEGKLLKSICHFYRAVIIRSLLEETGSLQYNGFSLAELCHSLIS